MFFSKYVLLFKIYLPNFVFNLNHNDITYFSDREI